MKRKTVLYTLDRGVIKRMVMFDFKKKLFNVIMFNLGDFLWQCKFQKTNLRVLNTYTIFKHLINPFKFYKTLIF